MKRIKKNAGTLSRAEASQLELFGVEHMPQMTGRRFSVFAL